MNVEDITLVTGNPGKAEQISRFLGHRIRHSNLDLIEIQSLDPEEIVTHKVREAYSQLQSPVLVEDVSLTFSVLGELPGPFIKWFEKSIGNDGLCHLLDKHSSRDAHAKAVYGFFDGENLKIFQGESAGTISEIPRGENAFGWDAIFIPEGHTKTRGEMNTEEKDATSIRQPALKQLETFLLSI